MHDGDTFAENCQLVGRRPTGLGIGLSWHLRLNSGCSPALKRQVEALLNKIRVKLLLEKIFQGREAAGRQPGHNRARRHVRRVFVYRAWRALGLARGPAAPRLPPAAGLVARRGWCDAASVLQDDKVGAKA